MDALDKLADAPADVFLCTHATSMRRPHQRCLQFPRRGDRNAGRKADQPGHMVGDVGNAGNADDVTLRLMTENSL